jgi:hypothetical protein
LTTYIDLVVSVVVRVESAEELTVHVDVDLVGAHDTVGEVLSRVLLHLNVEELAEVAEPLDELGRVGLVELDVGKEVAQDGGARVAREEEHKLGLSQVQRRQRRRVLKRRVQIAIELN